MNRITLEHPPRRQNFVQLPGWPRRSTVGAVLVVTAVLVSTAAPLCADRAEAADLVQQAGQLLDQGKEQEAREKLAAALKDDRTYPEVHANLGYLQELSGEIEQALDCYGRTLELAPAHTYAQQRLRHLFYEERFPRRLNFNYLRFSPLSAVVDSCQVKLPDAALPQRFEFAYTTSLLFPEEMGRNDLAPQIPVPAGRDSRIYATVNRVSYGLIKRSHSDVMDLRFVVQYPSRTISQPGNDYSELAANVTHLLLRFSGYAAIYLNRPPTGDDEGLVHVYLCEPGPAGAEQYDNSIYLYDIGLARTAAEWAREIAHELGHYLLPPVGVFEKPEKLGNGLLGEHLFLQWLAAEAELVTGQPWPSQKTTDATTAVLGGDATKVASYIEGQCRPALDLWLREGPASALLQAKSAQAMDYFSGFCLWVLAAHGPDVLAAVFDNAVGNTPVDFVSAYEQLTTRKLEEQVWSIETGALNLTQSQLAHPAREGAVRRDDVVIGPGDSVVVPLFLPAGTWAITAAAVPASSTLNLTFRLGEKTLVGAGRLTVSMTQAGWHMIRLSAAEASGEVRPQGIRVEKALQT